MESNKFRTIGYWAATGVVALGFGFGALADLTASTEVSEPRPLGYPSTWRRSSGSGRRSAWRRSWRRRFERLKRVGLRGRLFFDLTGAAVSHAVAGDPSASALVPMLILGFVMASWALRLRTAGWLPQRLRLRRGVSRIARPWRDPPGGGTTLRWQCLCDS